MYFANLSTTSWGPGKRSMWPPGCRPLFLKPKCHKESKNGFKPINFRSPLFVIFSNYFFSTKNHQKNWTFCWFFEILSQYMCISKTSSKKIAFRTSRIYWKITKILKTLSDNKPRVILYLYPYLFSQYSVTLFRFCAVPIVMTIHNFITLGNCSQVNSVQLSGSH